MNQYEVFTRDGETFLGIKWLWPWVAQDMRNQGYIVVLA